MYILGQHRVVEFGTCRYWANNGMICCEDSRDNSYGTISVWDMEERMQALKEMKLKHDGVDSSIQRAYVKEQRGKIDGFLRSMEGLVRTAKAQGVPLTEEGIKEARRRSPRSVLLSNLPTLVTPRGIVLRNRR
jgi:hypothetical protein